MRVYLEHAYEGLCVEYHTKPLARFLTCLRNTYAAPGGEVFIDASAVDGEHFCVFAELIRLLLRHPNRYIKPTLMHDQASLAALTEGAVPPNREGGVHVYYAVPPRLLRLKLKLSRNVNNTDVERICSLVEVEKELACMPVTIPHGGSLLEHGGEPDALIQLTWPERAVIECIDLCDAVFVSLAGGRALRTAVRRNVYLLTVFLNGCSVNKAVVNQVEAAARQNRRRFRAMCLLS